MQLDGHIHMVLDGKNWRQAIAAHSRKPNTQWIAAQLAQYQRLGFTYLRDGGDRWGVCLAAREMARDYGITYRCPAFPILSLIHISEPTRPSEISYAVFCLKKIFLMIRRPPRSTL